MDLNKRIVENFEFDWKNTWEDWIEFYCLDELLRPRRRGKNFEEK